MIVSHRYKFIFIKTMKTAGTSIEVDLNKILGEDDIATPVYPAVVGHMARNYQFSGFEFFNHMSASLVREHVGRKVFDDYFKFCVEREPVDKCISHYSMLKNSPSHNKKTRDISFEEYIEAEEFPVDVKKYTDEMGDLIVDKILRYEDLEHEFDELSKNLGFECKINSRVKSGFRESVNITPGQKIKIYAAFEPSNAFTGYKLRA